MNVLPVKFRSDHHDVKTLHKLLFGNGQHSLTQTKGYVEDNRSHERKHRHSIGDCACVMNIWHIGRLGMADIRRIYGGHTADIRLIYG